MRVYGWIKQPKISKPLLHTKLLVLGELQWWTLYPDGAPEFEELHFVPQQVWCGSANWSNTSRLHHEMGLLCNDQQLLDQATDYLMMLIAQSEPTTSGCAGPEPSFVYVDYPEPDPDQIAEIRRGFRQAFENPNSARRHQILRRAREATPVGGQLGRPQGHHRAPAAESESVAPGRVPM